MPQLPKAMFFVMLGLFFTPCREALRSQPVIENTTSPAQPTGQQQGLSAQQQKLFVPAEVISASDVQYPLNTTAEGIIVFNVSLSASGMITDVNALTNIPPLTNVAQSALQSWKFMPASFGGATEASQLLVAFVFRHAVKIRNPPLFNRVYAPREQAGYMFPGVFTATYAEYPASTIAAGATVVQVTVKADGVISYVKVVRAMSGGFVPLAVKAAKSWDFEPAMFNGTPVVSKVAIAFVFSSRALNTF